MIITQTQTCQSLYVSRKKQVIKFLNETKRWVFFIANFKRYQLLEVFFSNKFPTIVTDITDEKCSKPSDQPMVIPLTIKEKKNV
jgi:hypothetical protein